MNKEPLNSRKLISSMISSEAYRDSYNGVDLRNMYEEEKFEQRSRALGAAAMQRANENTRESGYRTVDGHMYNLMAQYDTFMTAQQKLDHLHSFKSSREAKMPYLKTVGNFNHTLREIIDGGGSSLTTTSLTVTLAETYQQMHGTDQLPYFMSAVRNVLTGMRHEIGFEQIIAAMPDVEYEEATAEEDVELGIDIKLLYKGIPINVDVKATAFRAQKANDDNWDKDKLCIWSQLNDSDFGTGFHIPNTLAEKKSRDVRVILDDTLPWINSRSA